MLRVTEGNIASAKGLVEANWLTSVGNERRHQVMEVVSALKKNAMSMSDYLMRTGNVSEVDTNDPIEYLIPSEDIRKTQLISVEALNPIAIGENGSEFVCTFKHDIFFKSQTLVGARQQFQFTIVEERGKRAGGYAYVCKIKGLEPFIPSNVLTPGAEFTAIASYVSSSLSEKGAGTTYSVGNKAIMPFTTIRKTYMIPGDMLNRPTTIMFTASDGSTHKSWDSYMVIENHLKVIDEVNNALFMGRTNYDENGVSRDLDVYTGKPVITGPGFEEQIERGITKQYSIFDIDELCSLIETQQIGRVNLSERTNVIVEGGFDAATKFSEMVKAKAWTNITISSFYNKEANSVADIFGVSLNRYRTPSGLLVDFRYEPYYDDLNIPSEMQANGKTVRSGTFRIMQNGSYVVDNKSFKTIELIYVKRHRYTHTVMQGPVGDVSGGAYASFVMSVTGKKPESAPITVQNEIDGLSETYIRQFALLVRNPGGVITYKPKAI